MRGTLPSWLSGQLRWHKCREQPQRSPRESGALGFASTCTKLQLFQPRHTKTSNHPGSALIQATDKLVECWPGLAKSGIWQLCKRSCFNREFQRLPDAALQVWSILPVGRRLTGYPNTSTRALQKRICFPLR